MNKHIKLGAVILLAVLLILSVSTASMAQTEQELRDQWEQEMQSSINLASNMHFFHNFPALVTSWTAQLQHQLWYVIGYTGIYSSISHLTNVLNNNVSTNLNVDLNSSIVTLNIYTQATYTSGWYQVVFPYSVTYTLDLNAWTWNAGSNTNAGQNIFTPLSWEDYYAQYSPQPEETPDVMPPEELAVEDPAPDEDPEPDLEEPPGVVAAAAPPVFSPQVFNSTASPSGLSTANYMATFFSNPVAKDLKLYVPGYAYFQGIVYSKGNITTLGPIRVIGGIINRSPNNSKGISLEKGAMLTTDPEYLNRRTNPPQVRLRITQWEEIPAALKSR